MGNLNVLLLHNRYQQPGGEDKCFESEAELLRARGHTVHAHVIDNDVIRLSNAAVAGLKGIWNHAEYRDIRDLIRRTRADLVHVHNFFPLLSPSVFHAAVAERVPTVQTLHNYRLLCPGALLFRAGAPCEECIGKALQWRGVLHGCYRNSRAASVAVAAMTVTHHLAGTWSRQVSAFIVPTAFTREKFIAGGFPSEKIHVKPNFVADTGQGSGDGGYALFVGRLTEEKGVRVLLDAWRTLAIQIPLKIVGAGPLERLVRTVGCEIPSIEYHGPRPATEVSEMMKYATALVFPSVCYETFGRAIIESFVAGTPVLASRLGAMESLVRNRETGLHFRAGDADDLAVQVHWMLDHPAEWQMIRQNARAEYLANYTPERNYRMLMQLYTSLGARANEHLAPQEPPAVTYPNN